MPTDLERDLGLYATITISIGAMIGSGLFVLPGLATKIAGPAVVLAYFLAGLIVLPAALSKAEMATAIPESGGTYLYIDRAMGPLPGTIAGIGAWFSLVFKSAFALLGLGAYLAVLGSVSLSTPLVKAIGIALAVVLIVVNVVGVKQTGRLQAGIVTLVLLALVAFVADGLTFVEQARFHPFFRHGSAGVLEATGFVFVSYAGVTKIASVAEEVENPGRNIPAGILVSIGTMMLVYTLVVFVIVGNVDHASLKQTLTPMADAAETLLGGYGGLVFAGVAVLALTSMANAGILASSRFPLAMSRDDLAPPELSTISDRFRTPVAAIAFTGVTLLVLIATVPVRELAKLASAFQILVFSIVNVALIAFRESGLEWYDPAFRSPGYPWVQAFGLVAGLLLLTQMGALPLAGAGGLVGFGLVWYRLYGRARTDREGAAVDALRRSVSRQTLDRTKQAIARRDRNVLVVVGPDTSHGCLASLITVGGAVAAESNGRLYVARFDEVPEQTTLESAAALDDDESFRREVERLTAALDVPVGCETGVTHAVERAVENHARELEADLIFGEWEPDRFRATLLGEDVDWYMEHLDGDIAFLRDRDLGTLEEITILAEPGIYDESKVRVAEAIAQHTGATLRFVTAIDTDASDELEQSVTDFYRDLEDVSTVPTEWEVLRTDDRVTGLAAVTDRSDLVLIGVVPHSWLYEALVGHFAVEISDAIETNVLLFYAAGGDRPLLRKAIERVAFGRTDAVGRSADVDRNGAAEQSTDA
ncbi:MAG: amino acid permease [Halorhabdus sp.]